MGITNKFKTFYVHFYYIQNSYRVNVSKINFLSSCKKKKQLPFPGGGV